MTRLLPGVEKHSLVRDIPSRHPGRIGPRRELVDENPAVEDPAYPLGFPAPDGEAADGRHASDHARSPIYRAAAPRCLSKKALISPKASFVSGA